VQAALSEDSDQVFVVACAALIPTLSTLEDVVAPRAPSPATVPPTGDLEKVEHQSAASPPLRHVSSYLLDDDEWVSQQQSTVFDMRLQRLQSVADADSDQDEVLPPMTTKVGPKITRQYTHRRGKSKANSILGIDDADDGSPHLTRQQSEEFMPIFIEQPTDNHQQVQVGIYTAVFTLFVCFCPLCSNIFLSLWFQDQATMELTTRLAAIEGGKSLSMDRGRVDVDEDDVAIEEERTGVN
jgi:hypothetical protein